MHRPSQVFGLAFFLFVVACSDRDPAVQPVIESPGTTNPLIAESPLPYGMPPFDLIRHEHFVPAFERGMAEQSAEIEAIAANPQAATFANTIIAMERSGQLLERAQRVFFSLSSAHTNDSMQEIQTEMAPRFSAHNDNILLNAELFARLASLYETRATLALDAEAYRLLERYHMDFVRAGAELSAEQKGRLREINVRRGQGPRGAEKTCLGLSDFATSAGSKRAQQRNSRAPV